MYPKKSILSRQIRKLNLKLGKESWEIYRGFMAKVLEDYPLEVRNKVTGLLRSRDFVALLEWADCYQKSLAAEQESVASLRATSQLVACIKKYPFPAPQLKRDAKAKALEKFLAAENRCKRYNLKFLRLESKAWDTHNDICFRMSNYIAYVLGYQPDHVAISESCSFGPGASLGVHGNTNLARKLLAKDWTCTPAALPFAISALARDQHLQELILKDGDGIFCLDPEEFRNRLKRRIRLVHHNKIVFVPKTTLVDRTIAVEPLLNGYLQKGVDVFMRRRLKRVGIDLSDQSRNQRLARLGSLPADDPFVTIDLSSASDSISTEMVRRLLPYDWFIYLNNLRAKSYTLSDGENDLTPYSKFVSMGNGFCFPLESLIFASVCQLYSKPNDYSVYGDDIIVRQSVAHQVLQTLWWLGFRHNPDKTFIQGGFRESCGADWFEGRDVRPLTLDAPLDTFQEIVKFFNLSLRKDFWSMRFEQVREYLFELVPIELRLQRPYLGVEFGAFEVPLDIFQSSSFSRWNRYSQCWSWLELDQIGVGDFDLEHGEKRYPTVLAMAAVRGSPSHKPFSKRRKTTQTVRVKTYAGCQATWLPPVNLSYIGSLDLD